LLIHGARYLLRHSVGDKRHDGANETAALAYDVAGKTIEWKRYKNDLLLGQVWDRYRQPTY